MLVYGVVIVNVSVVIYGVGVMAKSINEYAVKLSSCSTVVSGITPVYIISPHRPASEIL